MSFAEPFEQFKTERPRWRELLRSMRHDIAEQNPDALLADGFEKALIGYATVGHNTVALYDRAKCIEVLVTRDGMTEEDAEDHFSYNVAGAYAGPETPAFATLLRRS